MNLSRKINLFFLKHRNWGIPNLLLYLCIGSAVVGFSSMINGAEFVFSLLCFDKAAILRGEFWRLFTWLLTEAVGGGFLSILFLYFFYRLGSAVEASIGTFKFNIFYLSGVILMDVFALICCPTENTVLSGILLSPEVFTHFYSSMAYYLHLATVLAYATLYPDSQFVIFFVIPIKAWVIALLDLVLIGINVYNMCYPIMLFPHCLFPLIGLLNYFLFFGGQIHNLLPLSWRVKLKGRKRRKPAPQADQPRVIPFTPGNRQQNASKKSAVDYTHRCTVCGRTDASHPDLEFRYCSRCSGYHCYCEDHISNHEHITE